MSPSGPVGHPLPLPPHLARLKAEVAAKWARWTRREGAAFFRPEELCGDDESQLRSENDALAELQTKGGE